jgi:hypothetical protein
MKSSIKKKLGLSKEHELIKRKVPSFFILCTPEPHRFVVKTSLNIQVEAISERYLGLPTEVGKITSDVFEFIADNARSKVTG